MQAPATLISKLRALALGAVLAVALVACDGADEREANYRLRGKELFEQGELTKAKLEFRNALQIKPTSVEAIYYLGRIAEEESDLQTATTAYRQVVEQDAKHVAAQLKLGQFFLIAQDLPSAQAKAQIVLELEPRNPDGHALLAAVYHHQNLPTQAETEASEALKIDAANVGGVSVLAGLRALQGRTDEALQLLTDSLKLNPAHEGLRQVKIQILTDAKRMEEAEVAYQELLAVAPANHRHKVNLARLLIVQGKVDAAESMLRRASEAAPADKNLKMLLVTFLAERRGWESAAKELAVLAQQDPSEAAYQFRLAEFYAANQQLEEARRILQAVAEASAGKPLGLTARAALARVALDAGSRDEAAELIGAVLKDDPRNAEALLLRATMAADRQDSQAAVADLRTILRDQPNSAPALSLLARTYLGTGEAELSIEAYRNLLAVDQANVPARLALASQLRTLGRTDEALGEIEATLSLAPDSLSALKMKALMMIDQGNFAIAESIGKAALEQLEGQGTGYAVMGLIALARKDHAAAIDQLTKALEVESRPDEALPALVEAYVGAERRADAERVLAEFVAREPENGTALVLRADMQFMLGQADEAEATLKKAIAARSAWPVPYLKLGSLIEKEKRQAEALAIYEEGLARAPTNIDLLLRRALAQEALGQFEAARASYESVLTQRSDHKVASNNLAILIVDVWPNDTSLMDQARRLAEPFRYSNEPPLLDTLGWIQLRLGNSTDAVQLLERAAAGASDNQQIRYHLGLAYQAQGDLARARLELEKAVAGAPLYRGVDDAKKTLTTIGSTVGSITPTEPPTGAL